ncbi:FeoB-associated Cys-rich membrane protein [Alloiococcus sp. CFN-8]|uniref:FeoB-associated Cys-rich membrane protein n=1 Tax=Alloiococcus sp. CFN-8 TaxID=3416081 RepID=UPI003CF785A2
MIGDILVIGILVVCMFVAIRKIIKTKKSGGCSGCSGSEGCSGCSSNLEIKK